MITKVRIVTICPWLKFAMYVSNRDSDDKVIFSRYLLESEKILTLSF